MKNVVIAALLLSCTLGTRRERATIYNENIVADD